MEASMTKADAEPGKLWMPVLLTILAVSVAGLAVFYFAFNYIVDVFENVIGTLFRVFFGFG